ncbi:MAG: amidase [Dehalococcoidia bacterium]|nr:amidase [Dehalococcoidia bacterium]
MDDSATKGDEIAWMPATEMREAIRQKRLSPVEVTQALLERIDALNPALTAYVLVTPEMALAAARAAEAAVMRGEALPPLHGVPASIKDLFDVAGLPTTKGSLIYRDRIARGYEYSVKRLLDAGIVHLGKTNTPEFGFLPTTENPLFGASRNPWDPACTPGGSSGGAGAAVAAGLGPIALGSDGGGSIRIPASFCGIFGIKPTYGRVARNPGGWSTLTHRGPMSRTVADAALMLDVLQGREPADPFSVADYPGSFLAELQFGVKGRRVAWSADLGYALVDPEVRALCERAARRFEDLGCIVEEASPGFDSPTADRTFITLAASADAVWLQALTDEQRTQVGETAQFFLETGTKASAAEYVRANERRMALWQTMQRFHQTYDLLLTPTLSVTAFPVGEPPKTIAGSDYPPLAWSPYTAPFNLTGQPAASVPCGFDARGMPVGLQIVGRAYEDALVLRAARGFEALEPWAQRRPSLAAAVAQVAPREGASL